MKGKLTQNESLTRHTSFRIGGNAEFFFIPEDEEDLKRGLSFVREKGLPFFVIGNGSNILVSDEGIKGMVIHLEAPPFRKLIFEDHLLLVGAGAKTGTVLHEVVKKDYGGIEFLGAIPGTMGGAFFMNAGTYLGEMSQVTKEVDVLDESLRRRSVTKEEIDYHYRQSIFQNKPWVILGGKIELVRMLKKEAGQKVTEILERRKKTQPLSIPSAGSAFKNPPGASSWQLIEDAGLRGYSVGGAQVSQVHSNFVVNKGGATAQDVFHLMRFIQERVLAKTGILLEPEVRLVGEWKEDFLRTGERV